MKKGLIALAISSSLLLAGCGSDNTTQASDTFVMGTANFNGDFYDGWTYSAYDANIRTLVWGEGLLSSTPTGELVLSKFVESKTLLKSDPSIETADIWTFKIKDGMKFSNGDPLTAKDVKFTYDYYLDTKALADTGGTSDLTDYLSKVEIDEATNSVSFYFKKIIYTMDSAFGVAILDSKIIKAGAEKEKVTSQRWVKSHISTPIGYGPYKIDEFVESQFVKLSINENYQGDFEGNKPSIKNLIVQVVPVETQVTQLVAGEVDALVGLVQETNIDAVLGDKSISTNNYFRHGGGQITFHNDFGPSQLVEVRKAFAYEFDRIKFRNIFLGKYGISSEAPYSRNMWMMYDEDEKLGTKGRFESSLQSYDLLDSKGNWDKAANIAKTKELLDLAATKSTGVYAKLTKDAKGNYKWEGKPLTINLAITATWADALNLTMPPSIQKEFGITVKINSMDWSILANHLYGNAAVSERKYNAFSGGTMYALKEDPYSNWSATKITAFGKGSSLNSARYASEEGLLHDIRYSNPTTQAGHDSYKANWRKWLVSMNQDLPVLPLYSNNYYDAYTSRIENFNTSALWAWPSAIIKANFKK